VDNILAWLTKYSPPIVLLIGLGAVFLFAFKNITEHAISAQFDQYKKEVELRLQRRSNFEERVLLDRYTVLRDIQSKIQRVMTDLNRRRTGTEVEGLMRGSDIVPLTEVFELIATNRYLITDRFHKILWREAQLGIEYANARDTEILGKLGSEYLELQNSFDAAMNEVFGIDKITWETRTEYARD
jgi:hypothetical protein